MNPSRPPTAILRFPGAGPGGGGLAFGRPVATLVARTPAEVVPVLREVDRATRAGRWAVGHVTYEAAPGLDRALAVRAGGRMPLAWFVLHDDASGAPAGDPVDDGDAPAFAWDLSPEQHARGVGEVREAIARGEVYQVNLTARLRAPFRGDARALAARLARGQGRGTFSAWIDGGAFQVLCASPELFFRREGDRVVTRPMKGTARRGRFPEEDEARARALAADPKERAENVMIVDLLRNDLARVARRGGVRVASLCDVERWRTVLQMTSTVEADLATGTDLVALFRALFPCGSVTGAPKVTAMRRIAALEGSPREVYCGAVGVVAPGGDATFAVPIRTAWLDVERGELEYGVGSGVTWGSDAAREHDELLAKAAIALAPPARVELLETMRAESGIYARREAHLARLARSAAHLGVALDLARVDAALDDAARALGPGAHRVRLVVGEEGAVRAEAAPLPAAPGAPLRVALAREPIDPREARWFHKTTDRGAYDAHLAAHPGADDVLLWNDRGELTELTRGSLIVELDGERVTPPLEAGLLPGVLRAELLACGAARERTLRVEDVPRFARAFRASALRGELPIELPLIAGPR